ncbi:MAG: sigma-E processing peptidase SpoIIGA [Clostridia bacterium]|nr:sigma-E processing peptidase SpoIIGA [Clostridia bacterium]
MTVYVDVLLCVNLFVNYALISCSSMILKVRSGRVRMLLGSLSGSVCSLVIFLPELPFAAGLAIKIGAALLIVFCAFGYRSRSFFLRAFFTFFAVSFVFGGIMLALWLTVAPAGMAYNNGAVYFDVDIKLLVVSTIVCYAVVSLISHFAARRAPKNAVCRLTVEFGGGRADGAALYDTGNSLTEPFSGYPVIVAEYSAVEKIMPGSVRDYFASPESITDPAGVRLIMHRTVSGTGVMPAFRPERVHITSASGTLVTDKAYIAVTRNNIAKGEYEFIINPAVAELAKEKSYVKTG